MRVVQVHLRDGDDLLSRYGRRHEQDELFLAEGIDCAVGEEVALDLYFDHSGYAFRLLARVISRRLTRAGKLPPGARVALLPASESLGAMILAHARGEEIHYQPRVGARIDCDFPVRVRSGSVSGRGRVVDLAGGGMRVAGVTFALGAPLVIKLYPPGSILGLSLRGRVVWLRAQPDAAMGVQFQPGSGRASRRVAELVERLGRGAAR